MPTGDGCSPPSSSARPRCSDAAKASGLPDHRAAKALARLVDSRVIVSDPMADYASMAPRSPRRRARLVAASAERRARRRAAGATQSARGVRPRRERITSMPTAPAKREVVFDWLARRFEIGRRYPRRRSTAALDGHAEDHVSLRRVPRRRRAALPRRRHVLALRRQRLATVYVGVPMREAAPPTVAGDRFDEVDPVVDGPTDARPLGHQLLVGPR